MIKDMLDHKFEEKQEKNDETNSLEYGIDSLRQLLLDIRRKERPAVVHCRVKDIKMCQYVYIYRAATSSASADVQKPGHA